MIRVFKHYISSAYLGLLIGEWLIFFLAMYIGGDLRFINTMSWYSNQDMFDASIIFSVVLSLSSVGFGLYRRTLNWDDYHLALRVFFSFTIGSGIIIGIYYIFPKYLIARSVFIYAIGFAFLGLMLSRYFFYQYANTDQLRRRVLVLGTGEKAKQLCDIHNSYVLKHFLIHGFIDMGEKECLIDKEKLIRYNQDLVQLAKENHIDEIVVALDECDKSIHLQELLDCKVAGIEILNLLSFYEREQGLLLLESLTLSWIVFSSDGFDFSGLKPKMKRIVDLLASLGLLIISFPVMLITAFCIILESGLNAPILYRQTRVGENGKLFNVIKFRSMRTDAEKNGAQWATENDDRVTKVGAIIRKIRVDELPQIFNVLKGDMSFVGPRPERPEFVKGFEERIPFYAERHRVKPGITGWAQLCYPYGANEQDTINKLEYDLYYVKNYSIFLDISIIIGTVEVILWGKGAR